MSYLTRWLDANVYPRDGDNWDNRRFRDYVLRRLRRDSAILDLGAGRGALPEMDFRREVRFVAGVDPDPAVLENPYLHESRVLDLAASTIPYPDGAFDIVLSNNVLEHVERPETLFTEVYRILKPDGLFISKTPNLYHYVATLSRLMPHAVHEFVNELRGRPRQDTFPTRYRCNAPRVIEETARRTGFAVEDISMWEGRPEYLRLSALTYPWGILYERLVNRFTPLAKFRCVIVFTLQKKTAKEHHPPSDD